MRGVLCGLLAALAGPATAAGPPDFRDHVLPLLYNRCFSCHSDKAAEPKAGLLLDSAEGIRSADVVVPGKPAESELVARVSLPVTDGKHMPPLKGGGQPLSEAERELLRRWIADGAKTGGWQRFDHREPAVEAVPPRLTRSDVPRLARRVDDLIDDYHRAKGTRLNPPVGDDVFLRRVYLDVAGRVPTLAESGRFLTDSAPGKRAELIDELLRSEAYVSHTYNCKADQLRLVGDGIKGQPGWMYDAWVKEAVRSGMPYDAFVRKLVASSGFIWENGAVGFYLRDLGMPLDHTSNLARVFLGTRIECAQCHDHPFEPVTQKDFYQLAAYTFGVSNLGSPGGYSTESVRHWAGLQARLKATNASEAVKQSVSRTVAPLKRLTRDTGHVLKYPDAFAADPAARGKSVDPRTPFGDEAPADAGHRREALADWLTSPRNPRFAKNIANRLWKRVMGVGLIEPVDGLSAVTRPEHPALVEFLTQTVAGLGFDERAYLAVLLNTRAYQSEAVRDAPEPGAPFAYRGPQLRRLSAEQVWDSLLTLIVAGLDDRRPSMAGRDSLVRERLTRLSNMTEDELMDLSRTMAVYYQKRRESLIEVDGLKAALGREDGDGDAARRLRKDLARAVGTLDQLRRDYQTDDPAADPETDSRWAGLPPGLVRASEVPSPVPLGHFLRRFGQSDRREIDASNRNADVTHALALMNGDLTKLVLDPRSDLRTRLRPVRGDAERVRAIYQAVLVRPPSAEEAERCRRAVEASPSADADLIWALLNTPEFLFQQ